MAVIPIGAALLRRKAVGVGGARRDAVEGETGHAVLGVGQNQPVPVDRAIDGEGVGDVDHQTLALLETQRRRRDGAVDRQPGPRRPGHIDHDRANAEIVSPGVRRGRKWRRDHKCGGGEGQSERAHHGVTEMSPIMPES